MSQSGKWIDGIRPDGTVCDSARVSLAARLAAVAYWLPLAAEHADQDVEHIHRLRVSTRRAIAALKLYRDLLPRKPFRWLKKRLKKIRRAAGEARDLDVLAEWIQQHDDAYHPALSIVTAERTAAQPAVVDATRRCLHDERLIRNTRKLLLRISAPDSNSDSDTLITFRDWARERLTATADKFFAALPGDNTDTAELHQFRIRAKALRYTMELVASAFDASLRDAHYPIVEELQERLGQVNDCVAARERLKKWLDNVSAATDKNSSHDGDIHKALTDLIAHESNRLDEKLRDFRTWWTTDRIDSLQIGLAPPVVQPAPEFTTQSGQ